MQSIADITISEVTKKAVATFHLLWMLVSSVFGESFCDFNVERNNERVIFFFVRKA